jgi:hypothetical protein
MSNESRRVKRSTPALARVKCNITQAEEVWRRASDSAAKLSPAVRGDIVQVLIADSGIKWWLVCLNGRSNTAGWILRSRLDMIDDGEPLPAPPAILPPQRDIDSWGALVSQTLAQMPVVSRKDDDEDLLMDEKLDEFSNKVDSLEKHTEENEITETDIELRLQLVEKMLLNLPRHHKKVLKRRVSAGSSSWSPRLSSQPEITAPEEEEDHRDSVFIINEETRSSMVLLLDEARRSVDSGRTSMLLGSPLDESSELEEAPSSIEKEKKRSIKPWERKGFQFIEEPMMGALNVAKKKREAHHTRLQDLFNPVAV